MTDKDEDAARAAGDRLGRRGFFSQGFRHLFKPLAEMVEKRVEHMDLDGWVRDEAPERRSGPGTYGHSPPYRPDEPYEGNRKLLRPPGALPEAEFLARCTSCGKCVEVCPVRAIQLIPDADPRLDRKPAIDPARQACVICNDLSCMKACPTGALVLVDKLEIRMGTAALKPDLCVRSRGEDCQICVDKCPIGTTAIEIPFPGAPVSVKDACTGCGVCEMYCPTNPRAIVIEPRP